MKAIRLRTEYLVNPLGIDIQYPRLFWNCADGIKQTAYQLVSDQWDSGKISGSSMYVDYPLLLSDRERVDWKVRLWDENDVPDEWSEAAFFEMGITGWDASWITGNYSVNKNIVIPWTASGKCSLWIRSGKPGCILPPADCTKPC